MTASATTIPSVTFIGGGNMATSLISGLAQADQPPQAIHVVDPSAEKRQALADQFGVIPHASAQEGNWATAAVWVLAVKPQIMAEVCVQLAELAAEHQPLIISIAAGVPLAAFKQWLGANLAYVRCMPNTPALIGAGATGLYAQQSVTAQQRDIAEAILAAAGQTVWVDTEAKLDAVTATSGSGPAYYFAFMEAMQASAEKLGLDAETARTLVLQTALGAARLALESADSPTQLREKVTSPGGTTEQALLQFNNGGLNALVDDAMQAAATRADTLAQELLNKS